MLYHVRMSKTAWIALALVVAFLAGREAAIVEARYMSATARPLFRIHDRHVTGRDFLGRPEEIRCPRCAGYSQELPWVQVRAGVGHRCPLCNDSHTVRVDQTGLDIRQVSDMEPVDYAREPRR